MILLPAILWVAVWAIIAVVSCALLGLPPGTRMLETAAIIFVCGGLLLPLAGWTVFRLVHRPREP